MKRVGALLFVLVLTLSFGVAQGNDSNTQQPVDDVDLAYQCLQNLIDEKSQSDLSLQEAIFSTLALGSDSKLTGAIEDEKGNNCWPSSSCKVKETAQVLLAYDRINRNTENIESWLNSKEETAIELTWFLQVDIANHVESACTLTYKGSDKAITVNEDMTLSGSPGSCLSISSSGFWLRVNDDCIDEEFRVSCEQDFITSLLYQRQGSSTIFVSPTAHSAAAFGTTTEEINSKCFMTGTSCDYEGTLWSAIALDQAGKDVSALLPYLLALASENKKFFPNTFLYIITNGNDQYSEIVQAQQQNQYWQAPNTQYNRFYDTSLAMLSLQGTSSQELTNSKDYLLNIQTPEGCWNNNNVRDTAFVLYSGWSRAVSSDSEDGIIGESCIASGNECTPSLFKCADAGGFDLGLDCDFGICCSVSLLPPSCAEQNGLICGANQECSGGIEVQSLEGTCCLSPGFCRNIVQESACEIAGGNCYSSCNSNEEQIFDSCDDPGLVCCIVESDGMSGGGFGFWIVILAILIILAVVGIIFRKKLRLFLLKLKGRRRRGSQPAIHGRRPPRPPYGAHLRRSGMPLRRRQVQHRRVPHPKRARTKTDKDLEETLKKLKEMSK